MKSDNQHFFVILSVETRYNTDKMRVLIQRVNQASVEINFQITAEIQSGLLILIGIENDDTVEDSEWLAGKVIGLRIFDDENGIMNRSVTDIDGDILVVSQFTLHAMTKKGNRPSYIRAAKPEFAISMYEKICRGIETAFGKTICTGKFGADMKVELLNDGPVTIIIDSKNKDL